MHLLRLPVGVVFNDVGEVRRILRCCRLALGADDCLLFMFILNIPNFRTLKLDFSLLP